MRRRAAATLGAGTVLLLSAACANEPQIGFGGQPPGPPAPPPGPVEVKPVEQRTPVEQPKIDSGALPESYPKQAWTQDGGSVVVARGQEGGCSRVHAEATEQNARSVTVTMVDETPEAARVCTMDMRYPPVAVKLAQPLGDRTVVLQEKSVKVPALSPR